MTGVEIDIIKRVELVTLKFFCGIGHNWVWNWSHMNCDHFHHPNVAYSTVGNKKVKCFCGISHNCFYGMEYATISYISVEEVTTFFWCCGKGHNFFRVVEKVTIYFWSCGIGHNFFLEVVE